MGKTETERYDRGVRRADKDMDRVNAYIQTRFGGKAPSRFWLFRGNLLAVWLGYTAPLWFTTAGRGYDDRMQAVTKSMLEKL